jgi:hypothetical protein
VRNPQESSAIKVAILFGCATLFLTAVQLGLPLKGIQLNQTLGDIFLALAILSLLGLLVTLGWIFIPWVRNLWAGIKRQWPFALARTVRQLRTRQREAEQDVQELQSRNEGLNQENEELAQRLDERKRKRVEGWREFFNNFDYANDNVLLTAAYSDISPFLKDDIKDAFQNPSHVRIELDNRTGTADTIIKGQSPASQETLLLDEVTRIEREEWERL